MAKVWQQVYPDRLAEIYDYIDDTVLPLEAAWINDCLRWGDDATQTARVRAERIKTALHRNIEWLNGHLPVSPYASNVDSSSDDASPVKVYNLQGILIGIYKDRESALSQLNSGTYIVNGKKTAIHHFTTH